jgi:hypothetical protein
LVHFVVVIIYISKVLHGEEKLFIKCKIDMPHKIQNLFNSANFVLNSDVINKTQNIQFSVDYFRQQSICASVKGGNLHKKQRNLKFKF